LINNNYHLDNKDIERKIFGNFMKMDDNDSLNKLLYMDTRTSLPDNLLLLADKLSMAHSLELRVPYLDNDLISFLESLPSTYKIRRLNRKYIHKKAIDNIFPQKMIKQKKKGFETPFRHWTDENCRLILELYDKNQELHDIFNRNEIVKILEEQKTFKYDNTNKLIILLSLGFWYESFYCLL
jgi:asparagine synthase (glutamine-hydrolysing)